MVLSIQFVGTTAATANGNAYKSCTQNFTVTGKSSQSVGGQTASPTDPNPDLGCGSAKVRVFYQTYTGSPVYYTGWYTASGIVTHNPGNTILGANHDFGYKSFAYANNFPFTT